MFEKLIVQIAYIIHIANSLISIFLCLKINVCFSFICFHYVLQHNLVLIYRHVYKAKGNFTYEAY